ncbi:hypothetical protein RRV45_01370 [Bacillus sp. DTU_2020_1000418_1_SI_GHA_SEK_038]|uniref:hypothetical protein n=1 Tax=Bacillus sp. DTU_2020_1000418_1_SI_GHA_SEK_038 TaxID=3077585 RepID=UPI0028E96A10|nr:hypothetical protein [Bacillus sp. DTU_2020_1000418_1_SI_GHA_SEK_038]WNS75726.1 hypothetical protein RRV45_01370 [Bacillus sp. DTU_2020_1000418_1_SI_GHA_SEK_038]
MGCCSPEYRKVVNEQEAKVNQKEKDSVTLLAKIIIVLITVGAIASLAFLL